MRRSWLSSPWFRLLAVTTFAAATMAPACDPPAPPTPGGSCRGAQLVSGADFACIRVSPYIVCNDRLDAGGAGLPGCYGASSIVRCWGDYDGNAWANPATLEPAAFDAGAPPPVVTFALGGGAGAQTVQRIDRAGNVFPTNSQLGFATDWLQGARQVAVGGGGAFTRPFRCAMVGNGRVRCEGAASFGQLGVEGRVDDARPSSNLGQSELTFAGGEPDAVVAGSLHACVLLRDGTVQCWGANSRGALGPAASGLQSRPVRVTGLSNAVQLAAGGSQTCAIVNATQAGAMGADAGTRREVRCWGAGTSGQLGNGASVDSAMPVAVRAPTGSGNLVDVESIAVGQLHACAIVTGGAVYCWGDNGSGRLGVASPASSNRPVAVALPGGAGAFQLSAGAEHTCALMRPVVPEGVPVRCWGRMGSARVTPPGTITEELACCAPTPTNPRGICPNTQTDRANCGRTGNACRADQSCVNGACTCAPRTTCGAACVDLQSDPANCGACGNACPSSGAGTATCQGGRCAVSCAAGRGDCDGNLANGCETDLNSSLMHCGACGRAVTVANGTPACRMGAPAVMACSAGFGDCDANAANGCEATLATDANNCGRCGNRCGGASGNAMAACAMGTCGAQVCAAGFRDCNNDPADGCETPMGAACGSPPTALPAGSRVHTGGHVVNIVTGASGPDYGVQIARYLNNGGELSAATGEFYKYFRDEYDFLFIVTDRAFGGERCSRDADCTLGMRCSPGDPPTCAVKAAAAHLAVHRPAIPGTGLGRRYFTSYLTGAPNRLRGVMGVHQSDPTSSGPNLHELAHYWGVELPTSLFPESSSSHWGVSSVGGELGGFPASRATCGTGGDLASCQGTSVCCGPGTTNCGGRCVDTTSDPNNCGGCGTVCAMGPGTTANACINGVCRPTCARNYGNCDGDRANGCEVPTTTVEHCGDCLGVEPGFGCVDYGGGDYGPGARCGAADQVVCPPMSMRPLCSAGFTVTVGAASRICCAAGLINCGGVCASTATDRNNCGACGTICATGPGTTTNTCAAGRCTPTCAAGYGDCDGIAANGCEARLDTVANCGRCGNRCTATDQACTGSGASAACTGAAGSVGRVCGMGACGGAQTCSGAVTLRLPTLPTSDACRAASGRAQLGWGPVTSPGDTLPYASLELYLMGLVGRADAGGPWYVLDSPIEPSGGDLWGGSRLRRVTIDDVVAAVGERTPVPMAERAFRTATVVFSRTPVSDAWLNNVERWAAILGNDGMDACLYSFQSATGGRATMNTRIGARRVP